MSVDPLVALAEEIEAKTEHPVPHPGGAQSKALVMQVLRDPGSTPQTGAAKSGVTDPMVNHDATATRQLNLMREAGLDHRICTYWNASPWHVGKTGTLDVVAGAEWLREAIAKCPNLKVVIAMGNDAKEVARFARIGKRDGDPVLIETWHPAQRGTGSRERRTEQVDSLRRAAELAR